MWKTSGQTTIEDVLCIRTVDVQIRMSVWFCDCSTASRYDSSSVHLSFVHHRSSLVGLWSRSTHYQWNDHSISDFRLDCWQHYSDEQKVRCLRLQSFVPFQRCSTEQPTCRSIDEIKSLWVECQRRITVEHKGETAGSKWAINMVRSLWWKENNPQ